MKKTVRYFAAAAMAACALFGATAAAADLVILTTNDTHSSIDPGADGNGGILQRKAIVDSVRRAEKNVLLVDAGDVVQGSLYFKFFRGDVEYPLMNMMKYDVRILGNHEFDNGLDELAKYYRDVKADALSANYDFSDTPAKGLFKPYVIRKIAGKKVGIFGLNVDPESLISAQNYKGLKFKDIIATANETAAFLKNDRKCDLVIAVTHIGYIKESAKTTDVELAEASRDIDIIIGGHSHTLIDPKSNGTVSCLVGNAVGKPVLITQNGKYGKYVGYIKIDLDELSKGAEAYDYELIPVTNRFSPSQLDREMADFIAPFREKVDSVNHRVIAQSLYSLRSDRRNGGYANWTADFALDLGRQLADSLTAAGTPLGVDLGFMNVGGIRRNMPEGAVTEGEILSTFPFANRIVIQRVKGADIIGAMQVAARKGGEGVSRNVRVVVTPEREVVRVVIDGREMDPDRLYNVCTIDYVAEGNDDMRTWANGERLFTDGAEMADRVLRYIEANTALGLPIAPDPTGRFQQQVIIPD